MRAKRSGIKVLPRADVSYLDDLLMDDDGHVRPVSASALARIPDDHLMQWCVENGVYQVPTMELIMWLQEAIRGRSAIEVCAGKSGIGRALGIRATDSCMQTRPDVAAYYRVMGQAIIIPPGYVEKIDANEAVRKYRPQVVVGAFVTQKWLSEADRDGSMYGPLEEEWLDAGVTYIHIGNEGPHGTKRILSRPHRQFKFPWLRSRAIDQSANVIWVWND